MIAAKPTTYWLDDKTRWRIEQIRMVRQTSRSAIVRVAVRLLSEKLELEPEDH